MATSALARSAESVARAEDDAFAEAFARIENHYFLNKGWFQPETQLLDGVSKIRQIPAVIVQGRYDVVCPMRTAWDLHREWPEAKLVVVQARERPLLLVSVCVWVARMCPHLGITLGTNRAVSLSRLAKEISLCLLC